MTKTKTKTNTKTKAKLSLSAPTAFSVYEIHNSDVKTKTNLNSFCMLFKIEIMQNLNCSVFSDFVCSSLIPVESESDRSQSPPPITNRPDQLISQCNLSRKVVSNSLPKCLPNSWRKFLNKFKGTSWTVSWSPPILPSYCIIVVLHTNCCQKKCPLHMDEVSHCQKIS